MPSMILFFIDQPTIMREKRSLKIARKCQALSAIWNTTNHVWTQRLLQSVFRLCWCIACLARKAGSNRKTVKKTADLFTSAKLSVSSKPAALIWSTCLSPVPPFSPILFGFLTSGSLCIVDHRQKLLAYLYLHLGLSLIVIVWLYPCHCALKCRSTIDIVFKGFCYTFDWFKKRLILWSNLNHPHPWMNNCVCY